MHTRSDSHVVTGTGEDEERTSNEWHGSCSVFPSPARPHLRNQKGWREKEREKQTNQQPSKCCDETVDAAVRGNACPSREKETQRWVRPNGGRQRKKKAGRKKKKRRKRQGKGRERLLLYDWLWEAVFYGNVRKIHLQTFPSPSCFLFPISTFMPLASP